jgi:large subunit ribosomal protein L25
MSSDTISLTLDKREVVGKQVRALRREGKVPAVIHNHGKDSIVVDAPFVDITKVYEKAGKHHPVDLKVGSDKYLAIIRDVDLDPRKNTLRHVVFNAVRQNEKVQTEVPIKFEGDSAAEKAGLMLLTQLETVDVEATPRNLPDEIVVNVEALTEIGDKITVAELKAPDGVTIISEAEHPVVAVIETPAQQSEEAAEETAEGGEEAAQGETPEKGKDTSTEG